MTKNKQNQIHLVCFSMSDKPLEHFAYKESSPENLGSFNYVDV